MAENLFIENLTLISDFVFLLKDNDIIRSVSNSVKNILGIFPEELINKHFTDIIHSEDNNCIQKVISNTRNKKQINRTEFRIQKKDGNYLWFDAIIKPSNNNKQNVEIQIILLDITEKKIEQLKLLEKEKKYLEELKKSKDYAEKLIETANAIIVGLDVEGNITVFNNMAVKITGYKSSEVIGKNWFEIIVPKTIYPDVYKTFLQYKDINKFSSESFQNPILTKSGKERVIVWQNSRIIDKAEIIGTISFGIDITEKQLTENRLLESEEKFRASFENTIVGMEVSLPDGKFIMVNDSFCSIIGYRTEEMLQKSLLDIICPQDIGIIREIIKKFNNGLINSASYEVRLIHKSGKIVWSIINTTLLFDTNKKPIYYVSQILNDTNRKQNENIKNAVYKISELAHTVISINDLFASIHKIISELMPAFNFYISIFDSDTQTLSFPYFIDENDPAPGRKKLGKGLTEYVLKTGKPLLSTPEIINNLVENSEIELIGTLSFNWLGVPLITNGKIIGVMVVQSYSTGIQYGQYELDILNFVSEQIAMSIERKISEQELIIAKRKAEESSILKTSLLSNMNHELRTPMNSILGFSELLYDELDDNDTKIEAYNILTSAKRLRETLDSIIDMAEIDAGSKEYTFSEVNLNTEITLIINSSIREAKDKGIFIKKELKEELISYIDKDKFKNIIRKILDNAIKFTKKGEIKIQTYSSNKNDENFATINIIDTGIGIENANLDFIFEPFRQVSEGYNREFEGSGLGLTICKKITEQMSGNIYVTSIPGSGSIFTLKFPLIDSRKRFAETTIFKESTFIAKNPLIFKEQEKKSILIVEDNILNKELVYIYLKDNYKIEHALDGPTAIQLATKKHFDAILMDINLKSIMNGIEATKQIRKIKGYEDVPIAAVTGYTSDLERKSFLSEGCTHYLCKPYDKKTLLDLIHNMLEFDFQKKQNN